MMRMTAILGTIVLLMLLYPETGQAQIDVSAHNAVLMEQSTGRVLYEKRAHEQQSVASITKIMTAIIAIESGEMDDITVASRRAIYTEGSSIYLEQGEKMSIRDLTYGLMLRSGNDAAVAIAEHIGGSVEGFVHLMNEKAQWLGMTNTNFENPHGLESDNHYSTAYDMALLMRYAMNNDTFQQVSETKMYTAETRTYAWKNKNRLLTQFYNHCTGGKTGFTKKAGRTLVTSAHNNHMNLIAVTLNAPDDWQDHINMFEWGFENYELTAIGEQGEAKYQVKGSKRMITGYYRDHVIFPLTEDEINKLHSETYLIDEKQKSQQIIGKKIYYIDETPLIETPILSHEPAEQSNIITEITSIYQQIMGNK